jgi:UDP-N-acetylglucosamine/UDP-N-acetylgalactosamine diphosphorylase
MLIPDQPHLTAGFEHLSDGEKNGFIDQLAHFAPLLQEQRLLLAHKQTAVSYEPLQDYETPNDIWKAKGEQLIAQGKVAALILAGGQGSRLGTPQPKALIPITLIRKKSLLQFFYEKKLAASKAFKTSLQMAVMTSPDNHCALQEHVSSLDFFSQNVVPLMNEEGNWMLRGPGKLACGPDGNGHSLRLLMESGIGKKWKAQGIEYVIVLPIDNPLADPFDATLCGYHAMTGREATVKAIRRSDSTEKVGILIRRDGNIAIQEYSELPESIDAPLAHIGLFCFSLSFIEKVASTTLPWHVVLKKGVWKFERFIFDVLYHTTKCGVIVYPRDETYAPLKNFTGDKSIQTVQQALLNFDRNLFARISQTPVSMRSFELDPAFYYPTPHLLAHWKGKPLPPTDFVESHLLC